jgi:L-2-hydroxycarboxylate dehydrogenase (NAD+)
MKVKISELKSLARKALKNYGYDKKEAEVILDVLIYAQLRGNNQGLVKLIGKGIPKDKRAGKIKTLKNTKLSALLDGNYNFGMVVMERAMEIVLKKVKEHGFSIVGIKKTFSSTGAIGYYVKKIAKKGYLGFVFPGSPQAVAHFGSFEPMYGTNPLAVGIPSQKDPIVFDMATSAIAWFGLVEAKTAGKKIPNDVAYNSKGRPTTSPEEAMKGAIRPFDRSYKGSGLGMLVEILTGPLVKAGFTGLKEDQGWGNLVMAIDPGLLTTKKEFKENTEKIKKQIKKAKKLKGVKEVYLSGERGDKLTKKNLKASTLDIEQNLYNELKKAALQ